MSGRRALPAGRSVGPTIGGTGGVPVAVPLVVGLGFGFLLTASGLGDYRTIHRGLLLQDPYIYLMMAATIGTALPLLWLVERHRRRHPQLRPLVLPHETPGRRHVYGGALFGIGFGVTATCPGITIAMAGTGGLYGLVVLAGILVGLLARGRVEQREGARRQSSRPPATPAAPRLRSAGRPPGAPPLRGTALSE